MKLFLLVAVAMLVAQAAIEVGADALGQLFGAIGLRRRQRSRGWSWLSLSDCFELRKKLKAPDLLPSEEDVRSLPGYQPGSLAWLVENGERLAQPAADDLFVDDVPRAALPGCFLVALCMAVAMMTIWWIAFSQWWSRAVVVMAACMTAWGLVDLWRVRRRMRAIGYEWIGWGEAMRLCYSLGLRAHRVPPREHLVALPGYRDFDVHSIVRVCRRGLRP